MGYVVEQSDYSVTLMHLINVITGVTTVQIYRGSLIICYIRFRYCLLPLPSPEFPSSPTCY
jgi:hypothetical protein